MDVDFAGDLDTRGSTIGYVYTMGSIAVSWASSLEKIVVTEAEYVSMTEAEKEMI